jgi:hypothetical protein
VRGVTVLGSYGGLVASRSILKDDLSVKLRL